MTTVPSNLVPTKISDLPVAPNPTSSATMVCVIQGVTYQVQFIDLQSTVSVPASREINTGGGLQGGGDLSQNRTLSIATGGVTNSKLADNGVTPGVYGSGSSVPIVTVDAKGLVTSVSTTPLVISGYVPDTRQIIAGTGLTGGGNLQANRTLSMVFSTTTPAALGTAAVGGEDNAARGDHVHPALNFAVSTQYTGLLPLTNGGTGKQINSLTAGAVWYTDGSNGFLQTTQGTLGQVLVSNASAAPSWGSALIVSDQPANYVYAGPTSGGSAATSFRLLVDADIPATLTGKSMSGAANTFSNIPNVALTNSSVTFNGQTVALGASGTITATATNALTIGTGLLGTSYNGSAAVTITIDTTVATLTGTQTLTNKSISGSTNTLSNIANASLTNSSVTVGTTAIALGASSLTLGGLTTVAVTQDPVSALQLATKQYVDAVAQGLDPKASCVAATTANITLSGTQTIDGVALIAADRCLVKNQTLSQNNGIYLVAAGAWTRATDMDTWLEVPGAFTFIEQGTTLADTGWVCTSNAGGTLGTTAITFVQFAGVGSYTAGTGLTLTGTQFSITNTAVSTGFYGAADAVATFVVNDQGQLTLAANALIGINGNQITSGTVGSAYLTGSYTGITGVGTLTAGTWNATAIAAIYGGTGQTTYAVGDLLYASSTTALSKLADVATGNALISGGVTTAPSWGKIGLTTHVSGTLPVANGGTNITSYAVGDIVYASAATTLASLADVATGNALISGGIGVAPSYGKIGLTTHVSGTLPIANGGTNATTTPTSGAVAYGTGTAYGFSAAGTSGDFLISGGTSSPTWTSTISGGTY